MDLPIQLLSVIDLAALLTSEPRIPRKARNWLIVNVSTDSKERKWRKFKGILSIARHQPPKQVADRSIGEL
jgi:hypothetical protein